MTPARFASCQQLLRGINILEERHKQTLLDLAVRRKDLQSQLERLAELVSENNYADLRLLLPLSRRVGKTSEALKKIQEELVVAYQKEMKLTRARQMLVERIDEHKDLQEEEKLGDLLAEMIASKLHIQPSTRM